MIAVLSRPREVHSLISGFAPAAMTSSHWSVLAEEKAHNHSSWAVVSVDPEGGGLTGSQNSDICVLIGMMRLSCPLSGTFGANLCPNPSGTSHWTYQLLWASFLVGW